MSRNPMLEIARHQFRTDKKNASAFNYATGEATVFGLIVVWKQFPLCHQRIVKNPKGETINVTTYWI